MDLEKAYNKIDNFCCSNHNSLQDNTIRYLNGREEKINMFSDYQETKDDDFCKDADEMVEALETIKELVDLQKEIGCPLKILFRALKHGIYKYMWFDKDNPVFRHFDELDTDGESLFFEYLNHDTEGQDEVGDVYLKDYKKTWWLNEDRSE